MSKEVTREEMRGRYNDLVQTQDGYYAPRTKEEIAEEKRLDNAIRNLIEHGPQVDEAWLIDAADAALVALKHRYRSILTARDTIAMRDILADVLEAAGVEVKKGDQQ